MICGMRCGADEKNILSISLFVDEDGYTSISFVMALLVSLTLIFTTATLSWTASVCSDVQYVADSASLCGANTCLSYVKVARFVDGIATSMGICAVIVIGFGFVVASVPGLGAFGVKVVDIGCKILRMRSRFADVAYEGLERLEVVLPAIIMYDSSKCVKANSSENIKYRGCAIPFPLTSESEFKQDSEFLDPEYAQELTGELQEASDKVYQYKLEMDEAKRRGWLADCGQEDNNLMIRAATLSSMSNADNKDYPDIDKWNFGVAILRARKYYERRGLDEKPKSKNPEEVRRSVCRKYFYQYALSETNEAYFEEDERGRCDLWMPELFKNTEQMRQTEIYTKSLWYMTDGVLHGYKTCPANHGGGSLVSLAQAESTSYEKCPVCSMSVSEMGNVACASTNIDTGFEYWYREVVLASRDYQEASVEFAKHQEELEEVGRESKDLFEDATGNLASRRARLAPAGYMGCIAVVVRDEGTSTPSELTGAFIDEIKLERGAAISGAALGFDTTKKTFLENAWEEIVDSIAENEFFKTIYDMWLEIFYKTQDGSDDFSGVDEDLYEEIASKNLGRVGGMLKEFFNSCISDLGIETFAHKDLKPALVNTEKILDKAGFYKLNFIREFIGIIALASDPYELVKEVANLNINEVLEEEISLGEIELDEDRVYDLNVLIGEIFG